MTSRSFYGARISARAVTNSLRLPSIAKHMIAEGLQQSFPLPERRLSQSGTKRLDPIAGFGQLAVRRRIADPEMW